MKRCIPIVLFALGAVEIFFGILWGPIRIYAHEAPFAQALKLSELTPEQQRAWNHYIDLFQDQWHVVAYFGVVTVLTAVALLYTHRRA